MVGTVDANPVVVSVGITDVTRVVVVVGTVVATLAIRCRARRDVPAGRCTGVRGLVRAVEQLPPGFLSHRSRLSAAHTTVAG
ncbi:hypothetical protein [Cellulomonas sp. P24]|uniref:hypothetical protein n=1 Tax=Cellulomonas sp. P24 TaxID=2885206 RepID=UPI00216AE593|nr:hypothetical protein [Cellulomonas sp. P24]MCR6492170.1 hypothetical protein [Cellulomonas sp. P24]